MITVPATNQYNIALPGKQQHIAINIFPPLFGQAASSYYRLPWLAFNNCQPFCSTLQNPQWKAWLKRRGKERKSPHCNITYYLYSLWKTGLKHRILICQKKKISTHKHTLFYYYTGQTKTEKNKQERPYFLSTQEFSEQVRLVKLFPFLPVTYLFTLHGVPGTHTYSTPFTPTTHHHISLHCHHQIRNTIGVSVTSPSHYNFPYDAHDSDIFIECRNIH